MKIIISHPTGNQNSKEALKSFEEYNILDKFFTALNINSNNFFFKKIPKKILKELGRRDFTNYSKNVKAVSNLKELIRILSAKYNFKKLIQHEKGICSLDNIYHEVDKYVSKYIKRNHKNINSIYAYEDCALDSFSISKNYPIKCIYELPIGYWRINKKINFEEQEKFPKWSKTWDAIIDSQKKLERKDKELELADLIIVASSFTKKTLESYPNKLSEIKVIPYGFPKPIKSNEKSWYDKGNKLKILYVGGLSLRKGLPYLIESLKSFDNKEIEFRFIGAGGGKDIILEELPNAIYLGTLPHNEVLKEMKNNDVLIFPSLFEGFGMVITEAMSQGMVVISTDRTALPDVSDKNSSICIPASDANAITTSIRFLLNNPKRVKELGENALKRAELYQWSEYRKKLVEEI
jgi:glycosyltransferase involved in cell wall biosynthesis